MRRFPLFILIGLIAGSIWAQSLNKFPNGYRVVRDWGQDKGTATISNMLDAVSTTNQWTMIFDGGKWSISNSVITPSNITVMVMPGTYFDIDAGQVMTFQTNNLLLSHSEKIFTGSGTATGQCQMLYRIPDWGSKTQYDIGEGHIKFYNDDGGLILTWSNMYENGGFILGQTNLSDNGGFLVTTSSLAGDLNNLYPNLQTNANEASIETEYGFWPTYVDTNTVTISRGTISANGTKYRSENIITQDVTGMASGTSMLYGYLDDSASTNTTNVTIYTSTNYPTYVPALAGYYSTTSTADRVLFAVPTTNSALDGFECNDTGDLTLRYDLNYVCATNLNPDDNWQIPDLSEASVFLPVNASHAFVGAHNTEGGQQNAHIAMTTYEMTNTFGGTIDLGMNNWQVNSGAMLFWSFSGDSGVAAGNQGWMQLGASRNIRIAGSDDDENNLGFAICGWRIYR